MVVWRHDLIKPEEGDLHITVIFRDQWGKVQNGPIDHHCTYFFSPTVKFHYGWKFGIWAESRDSPNLEAQILLFEQFKHDRTRLGLYDVRVTDRMYSWFSSKTEHVNTTINHSVLPSHSLNFRVLYFHASKFIHSPRFSTRHFPANQNCTYQSNNLFSHFPPQYSITSLPISFSCKYQIKYYPLIKSLNYAFVCQWD